MNWRRLWKRLSFQLRECKIHGCDLTGWAEGTIFAHWYCEKCHAVDKWKRRHGKYFRGVKS